MPLSRVLLVSNRLPVSVRVGSRGVRLAPASGGLATGLRPWHEQSGALWIGWPGDVSRSTSTQRESLDYALATARIVPVYLSREQITQYYRGFANRVLWPLFHYQLDRLPLHTDGWDTYRQVNEAFADTVARVYQDGDTIWIHDYQLMLVPGLLRARLPEARIGFFLHIPFPSSEVFRVLPRRRELIEGLLGADLVGFHTFAYLRHFVASLLHIAGIEADVDCVEVGERKVKLGVFPMGVDAARFAAVANESKVRAEAESLRRDAGGRRIILGVDRLDYTKGIPRRLGAIERLLTRQPALRDRIRYIQVAVPSRGQVDSYQRFKLQLEEIVGRINGACATLHSTPVHYIHGTVTMAQLVALYRAADVMLVTPLRDGMNLVAKEFAASRVDLDGVLVLSELAGAAAELDGALAVNPYDVDAVAECLERALAMPLLERRLRMARLRRHVTSQDVTAWATAFLRRLEESRPARVAAPVEEKPPLATVFATGLRNGPLHLLLDYDGTLVPFARFPELARPDPELCDLLDALGRAPGIRTEIVSGRPRQTLEDWFGELPIALWAEHGLWHRPAPGETWRPAARIAAGWMTPIVPMLEQFVTSTPGSRIEVKTASLAWHYRAAEPEFGMRQAHELRMLLGVLLANQPLEVLDGNKVIEIRLRGISKALAAQPLHATAAGMTIIAIGDDRTDEELFRALPSSSVTIAVGARARHARYRLDDHHAVRGALRTLLGWSHPEALPRIVNGAVMRRELLH